MSTFASSVTVPHFEELKLNESPCDSQQDRRTVFFKDGPLGMTLEQSTKNSNVFVAHVDADGQAHYQDLSPGDFITSVCGVPVQDWLLEEVIEMIVTSPRPVEMEFQKMAKDRKQAAPAMTTTTTTTSMMTATTTTTAATTTAATANSNLHTVSFGTGSLGLKFDVDITGNVVILGLDPNGQAEQRGMLPNNSVIISIGSVYVYGKTYDEVFDLLADSPRPMTIQFKNMYEKAAPTAASTSTSTSISTSTSASITEEGEPPIIMGNFEKGKLGMTLEHDTDGYAIVTSIDSDGQAERNGIELWSTIVTVSGEYVHELHFDEIIDLIMKLPRPLQIGMQGPRHWAHHDPPPQEETNSSSSSTVPTESKPKLWKFDKNKVPQEYHDNKSKNDVAKDLTSVVQYEHNLKKKLMSAGRLKLKRFYNKLDSRKLGRVSKSTFIRAFVCLKVPKDVASLIFDRIQRQNTSLLTSNEFTDWVHEPAVKGLVQ